MVRSYFAGSLGKAEMEDLRQAMPSIPDVLRKLHTNPDNNKLSMFPQLLATEYQIWNAIFKLMHTIILTFNTGDQLERLLVLESEFGTLPGFSPALDAVIDFLTTVRPIISAQWMSKVANCICGWCSYWPFRAILNFFVGDKVNIYRRKHDWTFGGFVSYIVVHSEAYREAYRATWEEANQVAHHCHNCLLSNWKPSPLAPCPVGYTCQVHAQRMHTPM